MRVAIGTHKDLVVTITDEDGPVNLTGARLTFMARANDTTDPVVTKSSTDNGITVSDQSTNTGEAIVHLTPTDTEGVSPGIYLYGLVSVLNGIVTPCVDRQSIEIYQPIAEDVP